MVIGSVRMKEVLKKNFSIYKLFWIFLFGALFGAYYEELLNLVIHYNEHHEFVWQLRRGVLYGPISPIYGFGALLIYLVLGRKERKSYKTFFYGSILGGVFEYLMSFFQEMFFGTISWNYLDEPLNINGRTTVLFAFVWGLLALFLVKVVIPKLMTVIGSLPLKYGKILSNILIVLVFLDFFLTWGSLARSIERHNGIKPITIIGSFFDKYYPDEVIENFHKNMSVIEVKR